MNEELFWQIVASAQGSAEKLKQRLLACSKEELVSFHQLLDEALYQLDREEIHEITDGSDDGFEYVRLWIVSQEPIQRDGRSISPRSWATQEERVQPRFHTRRLACTLRMGSLPKASVPAFGVSVPSLIVFYPRPRSVQVL